MVDEAWVARSGFGVIGLQGHIYTYCRRWFSLDSSYHTKLLFPGAQWRVLDRRFLELRIVV
jgi:hypothetical protein